MMEQKKLLIIFARNPELGKVKTRLAADIGNQAALEVYRSLIQHTRAVAEKVVAKKEVHFSDKLIENDGWDPDLFGKRLQRGSDLGERMADSFEEAFARGFEQVVLIGSDLFDLRTEDLNKAYEALERYPVVLGPAQDGGYYLIGLTKRKPELFDNKPWGSDKVLEQTLIHLRADEYRLLDVRNDVDRVSDIIDIDEFQPFLQDYRHDKSHKTSS
jgi:rSAM/selenodomain-associated transferase 1